LKQLLLLLGYKLYYLVTTLLLLGYVILVTIFIPYYV